MNSRYIPVTDASAWKAADLQNDQSWIYRFSDKDIQKLNAALARVRHIPITEIRKQDFDIGHLEGVVERISMQIEDGIGLAVLRGLPVLDYTKDDASRIYWGLGQYIGCPVTQNSRAHLLGHVKDEGVAYGHTTRGYNTSAKLNFHTDNCDIVGLLCLRAARSGGLSRLTSAMSIFNLFLQNRPELLPPLFEGFYFDLKGEQLPNRPEISTHRIPVFSDHARKLSCRYLRNAIEPAFAKSGQPCTESQRAALDYFDHLADSPELCFEMEMQPGDMQLLNNHVIVHSRTAFEDFIQEDQKRHLLRLWLRTDYRPLATEFAERFGPGTARMGVPTPLAMEQIQS
ncbi:TauD/TfdA family dioxygenase [Allopusillimonas soli]|uniref:TauD/TfdA family dioxygenase n=1 Tax=Allopusillimonas soli TaxID=659016 RepID=A0A853F825_9BURK|nr:TauD/TfdA family dioxygenase [Allopusillimonas soli]NYT36253.1 TauD/TfdA family dioxygenase [Allopusillimonas soli]TEA76578.1 TauD/TfdA family dioxygenase [Allopusillimonas soli]